MEEFITADGVSEAEYTEKHSRFIAKVFPCESEKQAAEIIASVKEKYWDAKHNVYAYILSDSTARFSDDGEPHGTGGKPLLDCIKGSGLVDVLVVVTRYFGGILLGTGGLVRAYGTSASDALAKAVRVRVQAGLKLKCVCDYSDYKPLERLILSFSGVVDSADFAEKVELNFTLPTIQFGMFQKSLEETFSSRLSVLKLEETLFRKKIEEF